MLRAQKVVYFVRHGQSRANTLPVFQPLESPLSKKGVEQARLIAERAAKLPFEALISSPLMRAKSTAEQIGQMTGKIPDYSDLFVERIKPIAITGKSFANPVAMKIWKAWDHTLYTPGARVDDGENFDDMLERIDAGLEYLLKRPERKLLVVTHSFFLKALMARVVLGDALTGEAHRHFQLRTFMQNTGLSGIKYTKHFDGNRWRLWIFNDHAHLA
ncbi:MAG TPA: histidine phosphatase family protein [Candidatus Paceibacterota bacterium]|jgi:broad specificity phosphatase PhoE